MIRKSKSAYMIFKEYLLVSIHNRHWLNKTAIESKGYKNILLIPMMISGPISKVCSLSPSFPLAPYTCFPTAGP